MEKAFVAAVAEMQGFPAPHVASADDVLEEAARQHELLTGVINALALEPCHITGMHEPDHHVKYNCADQYKAVLDKVLQALEMNRADLRHQLHEGSCYWCHHVPAEEKYRQEHRKSHEWAGVPIPPELAATGR